MADNEKQSKKVRESGATDWANSGSGAQEGEPSKKRRRLKGEAADGEGGSEKGTLVSSTRKGTWLSLDERTAAVNKMDKELIGYPKDLAALDPLVTAQAKYAVEKLGCCVDNIVQAVAGKGLKKGYQEYAKLYKRPWKERASSPEFASHEVTFGHKLLYQLRFNELLQLKELRVNGFYDTDDMPCREHMQRNRRVD